MPDGTALTKEAELALIASPGHTVESIRTRLLEVKAGGEGEATAVFDSFVQGDYLGERIDALYKYTLSLRKTGGGWRALSSSLVTEAKPEQSTNGGPGATPVLRNLVPRTLKSWVKEKVKSVAAEGAPTFPELAYQPYKPGLNFVIPPAPAAGPGGAGLPVPPEELWLGYNYPVHVKQHVGRMLEIVYASGFSFEKGDRVLDLGCGAGRMIRHLKDFAGTCEIWGTDISAEHVQWCKQHLSPPFNFATTTKAPHLPFEDRSFRLIYCGSVFTHIDDLADAWLLELRRVLAPGGRLYLTTHDEHTVGLF